VCHIPGLTATTVFTAQDSFLGVAITTPHNQKKFTLFNFYSPGWPEPLAALLLSINIPTDCILRGDLNAHHLWWQGPLTLIIRNSHVSHSIANWLEDHDFCLQNEPAVPTHHPRNGGQPSTIDLCFSRDSATRSILLLAVNHDTTSDHSAVTVSLSLPLESHQPSLVGVGVKPTGKNLMLGSSPPEWTSPNFRG
jgi:hypothetical protein